MTDQPQQPEKGQTRLVAELAALVAGLFLLVTGIVMIGSEILFKLLHEFGLRLHPEDASEQLWGIGSAILWGLVCMGMSFAFLAGLASEFGQRVMDVVGGYLSKFGAGRGDG